MIHFAGSGQDEECGIQMQYLLQATAYTLYEAHDFEQAALFYAFALSTSSHNARIKGFFLVSCIKAGWQRQACDFFSHWCQKYSSEHMQESVGWYRRLCHQQQECDYQCLRLCRLVANFSYVIPAS